MEIDTALKVAVESVALTANFARRGAAALAIALMERIYSAEYEDFEMVSIILERYGESANIELAAYEKNIAPLKDAVAALYNTYDFNYYRHLGIKHYIRKYYEYDY